MSRFYTACGRGRGLALLVTLLAGCATYTARMGGVREHLAKGEYDAALEILTEQSGDKDRLLFYLNKGLIQHYADRWEESNATFQAAENLAAALYTKSISEGVFSLLTSDITISYRADPFEMAMIPYYRSLNYIYLQQPQEALVEARKASIYLQQYTDLTREALGEEAELAHPEVLRHNAFLQYWTALLYEQGGEINNAFIAYRLAAVAYEQAATLLTVEIPPWLGEDLRRTGQQLGFYEELAQLAQEYPHLFSDQAPRPPGGEVILLLEFGYVPQKQQKDLVLPILQSDDYESNTEWSYQLNRRKAPGWRVPEGEKVIYWLRVAKPVLVDDPPPLQHARVALGEDADFTWTVPVEDVAGRALLSFAAKETASDLKTIARALTKYLASKEAREANGTLGTLVNLFGVATETADTRSWLGLPHSIAMARWRVPPGTYDLQVELVDGDGETAFSEVIPAVTVTANEWRSLVRRVF